MTGIVTSEEEGPQQRKPALRRIISRVVLLLIGGLSLYLLAPKLIDVFTSWPQLKTVRPLWIGLAVVFEAMSYVSLWTIERIASNTTASPIHSGRTVFNCGHDVNTSISFGASR